MPRRSVPTRIGKWLATLLFVALLAGWTTTLFVTVSYYTHKGERHYFTGGAWKHGRQNGISPIGGPYYERRDPWPITLWPIHDNQFFSDYWYIPLWPLPSAAGAIAIWLWRRDRHRPGECRACGYSLDGLPAGAACPECGRLT